MHTYKVNVYRDGKWWMIQVPELDGYVYPDGGRNCSDLTQARWHGEIGRQARSFIATVINTDAPFAMGISYR